MAAVTQSNSNAVGARAANSSRLARWGAPLFVAVVTVAVLLPFVDRAFHIDDTVFLRVAQQIIKDPLKPYDLDYNWDLEPRTMWIVTQHPPLHSYIIAAIAIAADMGERTLHLSYLVIAVGCALLMYSLGRRFCAHPVTAALLGIFAPAFLVSATSVMADIPLLFFWLLSIRAAVKYADTLRARWLWLAILSGTAAAMTKYFGMAIIPLLIVYVLPRPHRSSGHLLALGLPFAVIFAWGLYAKAEKDIFHPLAAGANAVAYKQLNYGYLEKAAAERGESGFTLEVWKTIAFLRTAAHTLSYLGWTAMWPVFLLPLAIRLRWWVTGLVVLITGLAVAIEWQMILLNPENKVVEARIMIPFAIGALAGALTIAICGASWLGKRDSDSMLLGLWFFGTIVFAAFCNWTVNARVVLPAIFPAALLILRWIERFEQPRFFLNFARVATVPTLLIAMWVSFGDQAFANANRTFVQTWVRDQIAAGHRVFFVGHWGLQWYMEEEGAQPVDHSGQILRPGDLIVYPAFNSYVQWVDVAGVRVAFEKYLNPFFIHTMTDRAGFYTSGHACLPFNLSKDPVTGEYVADQFVVMKVLDENAMPTPSSPSR